TTTSTLSLHDALPICIGRVIDSCFDDPTVANLVEFRIGKRHPHCLRIQKRGVWAGWSKNPAGGPSSSSSNSSSKSASILAAYSRSEEHTSELQSLRHL